MVEYVDVESVDTKSHLYTWRYTHTHRHEKSESRTVIKPRCLHEVFHAGKRVNKSTDEGCEEAQDRAGLLPGGSSRSST